MPRVHLSGESRGTSSTSGELTVTQAVRQVVDELTPQQRVALARAGAAATAGAMAGDVVGNVTGVPWMPLAGAAIAMVGAEVLRDRRWVTKIAAKAADALLHSRQR